MDGFSEGANDLDGMGRAMGHFVNWLLDSVRWGWLITSFVVFVLAECAAVYYLYKMLGWL